MEHADTRFTCTVFETSLQLCRCRPSLARCALDQRDQLLSQPRTTVFRVGMVRRSNVLGWYSGGHTDESLRDACEIGQPPLAHITPRPQIQLRVRFQQ